MKTPTKKPGPGRPTWQPTDKQRGEVEAFTVAGYSQDEIAAYLGIAPSTLREHCRRELDFSAMKLLSEVAQNAIRCALGAAARYDEAGNCTHAEVVPQAWAMCFFLKTRGKKQGWSERVEHTGANGGPIEFDYTGLSADELGVLDQARAILARIAPSFTAEDGDRPTTH